MRALALAVAGLAACSGSGAAPVLSPSVSAEENPWNVLAMRLRVHAPGAATARAEWVDEGALRRSPRVPVSAAGEAVVDVLGLRPSARYEAVVEIEGPGGTERSAPVAFTTGPLPAPVALLSLRTSGTPPAGYLLVNLLGAVPGVIAAFDGRGQLRWYRIFEGPEPAIEAKQLADGRFLAFVGSTPGWELEHGAYLEVAPSGEVVRTFRATPPLFTDSHEALVTGLGTPGERIHLFGYESRTVDLAPFGLPGTGAIVGHSLQRLRPDGGAEFTWNAFDHLALEEQVNPAQPGQFVGYDYDHPNSLDVTPDGGYLVSFRNLDAVLLLDGETGEIRWRLGGARSEFTFVDDPLGGFSGQHDARLLPDGHLLLFDNGTLHAPPTSRAVEYELDPAARTARRVWEHRVPEFNAFTGSAVRDAEGTTWVGSSMFGVVERVARDGTVLWEGRLERDGAPVQFYRAVPFRSLYGEAALELGAAGGRASGPAPVVRSSVPGPAVRSGSAGGSSGIAIQSAR